MPQQEAVQAPRTNPVITDGPWQLGANSLLEPSHLLNGQYQWLVNGISRGGVPQTRPGFAVFPPLPYGIGKPRGMTIFTTKNGIPTMVVSIGPQILFLEYPFTGTWAQLPLTFNSTGPVVFETAIKNVDQAADGTITVITPTPILMISDGQTRTAYWDGMAARHLDPSLNETPIGLWMKWIGSRLWIANGKKLRASDLLNPLLFTEEDILSEGGSFDLPGVITGMGTTPDFSNLIVCTASTTTSFQSNITDRTLWQTTTDFQKLVYAGIGCIAGKSFINQWGIVWWMSQGGLISLDQAVQTYRSSRIRYMDQNMIRSKGNMSSDISGICGGSFDNFLMLSTPSGDIYNAHTWVMDQSPMDALESNPIYNTKVPEWAGIFTGIRPVEWVTSVINGRPRCFVLSIDYPNTGLLQSDDYSIGTQVTFFRPSDSSTRIAYTSLETFSGYANLSIAGLSDVIQSGDIITIEGEHASHPTHTVFSHVETDGFTTQVYFSGEVEYREIDARYLVNVWEAFIGERMDIGRDETVNKSTKEIACSLELRQLGYDGSYKIFRFAEIDIGEISGVVNLKVSYSGKNGGYKQLLSKQIVSTQGVIQNGVTTISTNTSLISEYRPQSRVVRTTDEETVFSDTSFQGVESIYTRKKDLSFSILIEWTGRMAVKSVRVFTDPDTQEPEGKFEEDELTDRFVQIDGQEAILATTPSVIYDGLHDTSTFLPPFSQRWVDAPYQSMT